jgi:uncharacterized damage-inducible protein DinB
MFRVFTLAVSLSAVALPVAAPTAISGSVKGMYEAVRLNVVEAAQQMPDAEYAFKPTPDVRSFAQLVGHIVDANFYFCSMAKGEASPSKVSHEKTMSAKADLVKALNAAVTYCDGAYAAGTDASFAQEIKAALPFSPATMQPRGAVLIFNVAHNNEAYGNVVTYMRLKGHVPPSTARTSSR